MNILITGGAGYIGSHVAMALLDAGYKVTIVDNLSTGNLNLVPSNAEFFQCNINNSNKIDKILKSKSFDAVMHFAAFISVEESVNNPKKYFENNSKNSEIFFDICLKNGLKNFIFSSTASAYGQVKNIDLISENEKIKPLNPYGESKIITEKYFLKKNNNTINYIILRYFNVAGADPKLRSGLISKKSTHLIKIISEAAVGKRKSVIIYGNDYNTPDGTAIRDYIHVSDLADLHIKFLNFMKKNNRSEIFNCGYGKGYSVKEVLDVANKISNNNIKIIIGERRKGDSEKLISDTSKLRELINWKPKYNKLDFIIKTSIDWELKIKNEKN